MSTFGTRWSLIDAMRTHIAAVLLLVGVAAAYPAWCAPNAEPMALGNPRAPVTVIEYASVGCPHCAQWEIQVFPIFREKYIDSGRVRFVFHEVLAGNPILAAAGFLLARCAPRDKYFKVVDSIFEKQNDLASDGPAALARIGADAGLTRRQFDACLQDSAALNELVQRTEQDAKANGVTGTPTFFVDDQRLDGEASIDELDAAIARAAAQHGAR